VCVFFQAEDGIRDFHVTGVQTCALPTSSPSQKLTVVKPVSATGFDPLGDDKTENPEYAGLAIDGKPSTEWHTQSYTSADLGRLRSEERRVGKEGRPRRPAEAENKHSGTH